MGNCLTFSAGEMAADVDTDNDADEDSAMRASAGLRPGPADVARREWARDGRAPVPSECTPRLDPDRNVPVLATPKTDRPCLIVLFGIVRRLVKSTGTTESETRAGAHAPVFNEDGAFSGSPSGVRAATGFRRWRPWTPGSNAAPSQQAPAFSLGPWNEGFRISDSTISSHGDEIQSEYSWNANMDQLPGPFSRRFVRAFSDLIISEIRCVAPPGQTVAESDLRARFNRNSLHVEVTSLGGARTSERDRSTRRSHLKRARTGEVVHDGRVASLKSSPSGYPNSRRWSGN